MVLKTSIGLVPREYTLSEYNTKQRMINTKNINIGPANIINPFDIVLILPLLKVSLEFTKKFKIPGENKTSHQARRFLTKANANRPTLDH